MNRWRLSLTVVALVVSSGYAAAATQTITEPFIGVRLIHRVTTSPRLIDAHILEIDPTAPGIGFLTTPSNGAAPGETTAQTTRSFVTQHQLQLGVNGSFYAFDSGINTSILGLSASNGDVYSDFQSGHLTALNVSANNLASIIDSLTGSGSAHAPSTALYNAIGGNERIIANGVLTAADTTLHPRTGAGVTADGKLLLVTVDGRNSAHSLGVTTIELAEILLGLGAVNAINLDGGGSTTMVIADATPRVVNVPVGTSDVPGSERSNGNNFGVYAQVNQRGVNRMIYADFESGDESLFPHSLWTSNQTSGIHATSSSDARRNAGRLWGGAQRISIVDDPTEEGSAENPDGWFIRQLAGGDDPTTAGTRAGNLPRRTAGVVGFWARTSDSGITASIALDDANDVTSFRGIQRELIADGTWRRYAWDLRNPTQWESWSEGTLQLATSTFTIDSIQFSGPNSDALILLDDVFHEELAIFAGDFNMDGTVDGNDLTVWKAAMGQSPDGDADRDGDTDGSDFLIWQRQYSASNAVAANAAIPEPSALAMLSAVSLVAALFRSRK